MSSEKQPTTADFSDKDHIDIESALADKIPFYVKLLKVIRESYATLVKWTFEVMSRISEGEEDILKAYRLPFGLSKTISLIISAAMFSYGFFVVHWIPGLVVMLTSYVNAVMTLRNNRSKALANITVMLRSLRWRLVKLNSTLYAKMGFGFWAKTCSGSLALALIGSTYVVKQLRNFLFTDKEIADSLKFSHQESGVLFEYSEPAVVVEEI
jgi:hypothetical protein